MNETVTRALSGLVYIIILISAILFSKISFVILFAAFMLLAIYEYCRLVKTGYIIPAVVSLAILIPFVLSGDNKVATLVFTIFSSIVNSYLLFELFNKNSGLPNSTLSKIVRLTGYVIFPFILIIRLPFLDACEGGRHIHAPALCYHCPLHRHFFLVLILLNHLMCQI